MKKLVCLIMAAAMALCLLAVPAAAAVLPTPLIKRIGFFFEQPAFF